MKMIILAAGQGSRLRPLTNDKPKCMVEYKNKAMIDYILDVAQNSNFKEIAIVGGYKIDVLKNHLKDKEVTFYKNDDFDKTNMLHTLFCAKDFLDDDIIISYADIIYNQKKLDSLIESKDDFSVVIDKNWYDLWSIRMDNPLEDAETLKVENEKIIEIGKKAKSYDEIEGQYIGLIKISKKIIKQVIDFYENLDENKLYDGKDFKNMYMTTFIQLIIDNLLDVKPTYIERGWFEVDTLDDLKAYVKANLTFDNM